MRSEEYPVVEAAGEGGPAARGAFQAEYLVPQGRKWQSHLEGYACIHNSGEQYGSVKDHENKPDGIL